MAEKEKKKEVTPQQYMGFWKDVFLKSLDRYTPMKCADLADEAIDRIRQKFE